MLSSKGSLEKIDRQIFPTEKHAHFVLNRDWLDAMTFEQLQNEWRLLSQSVTDVSYRFILF